MRGPQRRGPSGGERGCSTVIEPPLLGGSKPGYQHEVPKHGDSLLGWRVKVTYPTGPKLERRWHNGYIFQVVAQRRDEDSPAVYKYRA